METENKKDLILYVCSILLSLFIFGGIFAPWISYQSETYTIYEFYSAVSASGGISRFGADNPNIYPSYGALILPALAGLLAGINVLALTFKGRIKIVAYGIYGLEWLYMGTFFAFPGYMPTVFACSGPVLAMGDFLLNRYLEDYREINRKNKAMRMKDKEAKEERKRRLSFPGKYSRYYYSIVLKNIRYHIWEYFLLIVSGSFSVMFLFSILAVQDMVEGVHTKEMFMLGGGLQDIMKDAVVAAIIINVVIMGFSLSYFVKKKLSNEQIMILLGTRSSLLKKGWVTEYGACLVGSVILGCFLGTIVSAVFPMVCSGVLEGTGLHGFSWKIYLETIVIFVLVSSVSLAVNYEVYTWQKYAGTVQIKRERIPKSKEILIGVVLGGIFVCIAVICFRQRRFAESMNCVYLFLGGIALLLIYVFALWIKRIVQSPGHSAYAVERAMFTYHFQGSTKTLAVLTVLHFLILFVYTLQFAGVLSAQPSKELYPYEFVCMAYPKEHTFFENLESEGAVVEQYPMVRVTSVEGDAFDWIDAANNSFMQVIWSQGQHVGVSETTYMELKKKREGNVKTLNLKGEEIYIVYQQDSSFKAHPLDWYLFRGNPYLRIGQPLRSYSFLDREKLYPPRSVKGEEIHILTGMFQRGMQENLVVFSDAYFEKLESEGPTEYYLIHAEGDIYKSVKKQLSDFAARHQEDSSWDDDIQPYYESRQMIKNTDSERILKSVVSIFELLMLTVCTILILSLKIVSEYEELSIRYQLLSKIGMHEKEQRKLVRKELSIFFYLPILLSTLFAAGFTSAVFGLRMYQQSQVNGYLRYAGIVWFVYFLIQIIFYQGLKRKLYTRLEIKKEEED